VCDYRSYNNSPPKLCQGGIWVGGRLQFHSRGSIVWCRAPQPGDAIPRPTLWLNCQAGAPDCTSVNLCRLETACTKNQGQIPQHVVARSGFLYATLHGGQAWQSHILFSLVRARDFRIRQWRTARTKMKMDSPPSADSNEYGGIGGFADGPALLTVRTSAIPLHQQRVNRMRHPPSLDIFGFSVTLKKALHRRN